jgi:hypothetical protein
MMSVFKILKVPMDQIEGRFLQPSLGDSSLNFEVQVLNDVFYAAKILLMDVETRLRVKFWVDGREVGFNGVGE